MHMRQVGHVISREDVKLRHPPVIVWRCLPDLHGLEQHIAFLQGCIKTTPDAKGTMDRLGHAAVIAPSVSTTLRLTGRDASLKIVAAGQSQRATRSRRQLPRPAPF